MAFKATRNMPFSLVLQKLSSFSASSEIFDIVDVILKVILVNLLTAQNFANVFLNKKRLKNKKTLKNVNNVTKIKKNVFYIYVIR